MISPTPLLAALPATVPFVGPEHLAREAGLSKSALLRLGANESSFGPAPAVFAALEEAFADVRYYGDPDAFELRRQIAQRHWASLDGVLVAGGIDELLGLFVRAYLAPGATALMTAGSYPTFAYHVRGYGGELCTVPYAEGRVDLAALALAAVERAPALVYIANPDNPSGRACEPGELEAFFASVPSSTLILLDEAYAEYAPEALPVDIMPNVVRFRTFSKAYGLAGMRVGYALAEPQMLAPLQKIRLHFGVGTLAQTAALAALARPAYVASVVAETARGRLEYAQFADELRLKTYPSATNFVLFELDTALRAEAVVEALFARSVFVRKPMIGSIASCIRVTVGAAHERRRFRGALAAALTAVGSGTP